MQLINYEIKIKSHYLMCRGDFYCYPDAQGFRSKFCWEHFVMNEFETLRKIVENEISKS